MEAEVQKLLILVTGEKKKNHKNKKKKICMPLLRMGNSTVATCFHLSPENFQLFLLHLKHLQPKEN